MALWSCRWICQVSAPCSWRGERYAEPIVVVVFVVILLPVCCVDRSIYISGRYHRVDDGHDAQHVAIATNEDDCELLIRIRNFRSSWQRDGDGGWWIRRRKQVPVDDRSRLRLLDGCRVRRSVLGVTSTVGLCAHYVTISNNKKPIGVAGISSQGARRGCPWNQAEITEKFMHKYNKLENWTG